jgi:hypothetical protein
MNTKIETGGRIEWIDIANCKMKTHRAAVIYLKSA